MSSKKKRRRRPGRPVPPRHEFRGSFFEGPTHAPAGRLGVRARRFARVWGAPLWAHLAALTLLVLLLAQAMYLTKANWVNDEGLYALQTLALHEGSWEQALTLREGSSWEYDYAGAEFDPEGRWQPILTSTPVDGRQYPYVKHPVYSLLLYGSTSLLGIGWLGFFAVPMLGLVLAAFAAWLLAAEFEPRAARPAFWIVAVSPLAVNAYVLWAHTLSAGIAGLAVVALVRVVKRGPTACNVAGLAATCAVGIPIRTEGLLFAVTVPLVAVGVLVYRKRYLQALALGAACYAAAVAALVAEAGLWSRIVGADLSRGLAWVLSGSPARRAAEFATLVALAVAAVVAAPRLKARPILALALGTAAAGLGLALMAGPLAYANVLGIEGETPIRAVGGFLEARGHAFWRTFFDPSGQSRTGSVTLLAALVVLAVVGLALRLRGRELSLMGMGVAAAGLLVGVWLYAVRFVGDPTEFVSGFFAAWPLALLGLLLLPWRATSGPERAGAAAAALFAGTVFLTQYESGAAVEWGGRFLSPAVVPLAALVAVGLFRSISARSWRQRWVATAFLVAVAAFPISQGIGVVRSRANAAPIFADVGAAATDVVIVAHETLWGLYQDAWTLYRDRDVDVFFVDDVSGHQLLGELRSRGVDDVTLVQSWRQAAPTPDTFPDTYPSVAEVTPPYLGSVGVRMFVISRSGPPA